MEELRKICEIIASSRSYTNWVLKLLENQDVLVRRFNLGDREKFIIFEKSK